MKRSESRAMRGLAGAAFIALVGVAGIALWRLAEPEVSAQDVQPAAAAGEALATIGDETITVAEVEAAVAGELLKIEQERHTILEQGLQGVIADRLANLEAADRGITVDELFQQEVATRVSEPTEEEVDAFYEQNKAQIRQPKEQIADQIQRYLVQQRQQTAATEMLEALKAKWKVKTHLEPFRVQVASEGFPALGPADAPVTIVEFSDFECPYCSRVVPTLEQVRETYSEQVRVVFRQFPLTGIHPNAMKAAMASLCAHEQESFWPMHDKMFDEQRKLSVEDLKKKAALLSLDTEAFNECLDSDRHADAVRADMEAGASVGVTATPALFINGRLISGAQPYENIAAVVDDELARHAERAN